jgi:Rieske Fe-S protein
MTERPSRRDAVRRLVQCAGCALALPALGGCTISRVFGGAGGNVSFDLADAAYAPLREVGGLVPVDSGARRLLLIRVSASEIAALDRICTHAACDMSPDVDGRWDGEALVCVCHDSRFAPNGEVLRGPATRDLESFPVDFDEMAGTGTVQVGEPPEDPILVVEPDADGRVVVDFADAPALAEPEGVQAVDAGTFKLLVIRVDEDRATTVLRLCTHAVCDMAPHLAGRYADGVLECTCHGSRFSPDGELLQGPALAPLRSFPTTLDGDRVVIEVGTP